MQGSRNMRIARTVLAIVVALVTAAVSATLALARSAPVGWGPPSNQYVATCEQYIPPTCRHTP